LPAAPQTLSSPVPPWRMSPPVSVEGVVARAGGDPVAAVAGDDDVVRTDGLQTSGRSLRRRHGQRRHPGVCRRYTAPQVDGPRLIYRARNTRTCRLTRSACAGADGLRSGRSAQSTYDRRPLASLVVATAPAAGGFER
jgi:hypothetical protein